MTKQTTARVVLGGRTHGQQGLVPGVIEEAVLAIRSGLAVYLLGGFGGAAEAMLDALRGGSVAELTEYYQLRNTPGYAELLTASSEMGGDQGVEEAVADLIGRGWECLNNRLTAEENELLAVSPDIDDIIPLVLRGLRNVQLPY
jgi:hypothetical protein